MLNLNLGGALRSQSPEPSVGFKLNVKVNHATTLSPEKNSAPGVAKGAATASRSSVDRIFEDLFEDNALGKVNMLSKLSYKVETGEGSDDFANYIKAFALDGAGFKQLSDYDAQGMVTTIAAKYTALSQQIDEGLFADGTKQKMHEELERQLQAGLEDLAQYYGDSASTLFQSLGIEGQKDQLGKSLTDLVLQKKDEMLAFVNSEAGKEYLKQAQLKDEGHNFAFDDVALTKALIYHEAENIHQQELEKEQQASAQAAKQAHGVAKPQDKSANQALGVVDTKSQTESADSFTLQDLKALGKLQSTLSNFVNDDKSKSEEELGYQLGLTKAKGQAILQQAGASSYLSELFNSNFDNFINSKVKDINEHLKDKQKEAADLSVNAEEAYKEFNLNAVMDAFKATTSVYETTGSLNDTVVNGFELVKNSFLQQQQLNGTTMRYKNDSFFSSFYHTDKDNNAYDMGMSTFRRYHNTMSRL